MKAPTKYNYPHEVFAKVGTIESFHDRVKYLKDTQTFAIRTILQCNFNPHILLDLPEGAPPFNRDGLPPENSMGRIDKSIKVLGRIAIVGGKPSVGLERMRKETQFIQLLESVHSADADIILAMKSKTLDKMFPTIDKTLVDAAFPGLSG